MQLNCNYISTIYSPTGNAKIKIQIKLSTINILPQNYNLYYNIDMNKKLYLIETNEGFYGTTGENKTDVGVKFILEYEDRKIINIKEISAKQLQEIPDNDDIIFF